MPEFKDVLESSQGDEIESSGETESSPSPKGTLIMRRNLANGRTAFQLTTGKWPHDFTPFAGVILVIVRGFPEPGCRGEEVDWRVKLFNPPVRFDQPKELADGRLLFKPGDHDRGALTEAIAAVGCERENVRSYGMEILIRVGREALLFFGEALEFQFCFDCADPEKERGRGA